MYCFFQNFYAIEGDYLGKMSNTKSSFARLLTFMCNIEKLT